MESPANKSLNIPANISSVFKDNEVLRKVHFLILGRMMQMINGDGHVTEVKIVGRLIYKVKDAVVNRPRGSFSDYLVETDPQTWNCNI